MYKVLLADNEQMLLTGMKFMADWEKAGCKIVAMATDGKKAIEKIWHFRPDIVICEINLPLCSGIRVLEKTTACYPEIVFVMLTDCQEFELVRQAFRFRASDYLLKTGLQPAELFAAMQKAGQESERRRKLCRMEKAEDYQINKHKEIDSVSRQDSLDYLSLATEYIQLHMKEKITLKDVAAHVSISPNYLSTLFTRKYHQNFIDYVNTIKMQEACRLIEQNQYLIYEVAYQLGYENAYYFSKIFKKHIGQTPKEYQATGMKG